MTALRHACALALLSNLLGCSGIAVGTGTADAGAGSTESPGSSGASASSGSAGSSGTAASSGALGSSGAPTTSGGASGTTPLSGACNYTHQEGARLSFYTVQEAPPTLAGGTITDGTWATSSRVAYVPSKPTGSEYNDWYGETYVFDGNSYEWVLGVDDFHVNRESGTFTTDGNTITFQPLCAGVDASRDPSPHAPKTMRYTATATTLTLIDVMNSPEVAQTLTKQ